MLPINTLGEDYTLKDIAELSDKRLIKAYQSALNEKSMKKKMLKIKIILLQNFYAAPINIFMLLKQKFLNEI